MDNENVIELTNDLTALEIDMSNWSNLTFDLRKRSDIACQQKYGCTNIELYNSIKANIIKNEPPKDEPVYMNENFRVIHDPGLNDIDKEIMISNIQDSLFIQKRDPNIVIINDFISDEVPDYEMDDLLQAYDRYTRSSNNYKVYSNEYSLQIWGKTVPEMFTYMRSKLQRIRDLENRDNVDLFVSPTDKSLIRFQQEFDRAKKEKNFIEYCIKSIDAFDKHETLYESLVLEEITKDPFDKNFDYKNDVPYITPFLNFNEYSMLNETDLLTPFSYIFIEDTKKYYDTIVKLSSQYQKTKNEVIEEQLIKLGWNPVVPVNGETIKYAREKQIKWLNENEKCTIIDLSKINLSLTDELISETDNNIDMSKLEPIYIVLSYSGTLFGKVITAYKKCTYSHAGLALDPTLNEIYSFSIKSKAVNGFVVESLDDYHDKNGNANILVMALFINAEMKEKIKENIEYYIKNQDKTKYSIKNIIRIVFNKTTNSAHSLEMVCSQFVDNILKLSGLDITGKSSNLVAPEDLVKPATGINIFALFEGKKSNYDWKVVQDKVNVLKKKMNFNRLIAKTPQKLIADLRENLLEVFRLTSEDKRIENILREMREYITIKPSIVSIHEMKSPIGFNKDGGLYIKVNNDLQSEYNEAHKLLSMYNESNLVGIKNELARLFYLNSIIENKLKKVKKEKHPDTYKELIDLRARILNDYTTYFKLVKTIEKDFDFMEYMKNSDYYNKYLVIDDNTLKFSGSYIKKFFQSMIGK